MALMTRSLIKHDRRIRIELILDAINQFVNY